MAIGLNTTTTQTTANIPAKRVKSESGKTNLLSIRIGKQLQADQFFVIQFEDYPCTDGCDTQHQLLMRLNLMDASTGEIVWRGRIHHKLEPEELEPEPYTILALELTDELWEAFSQDFIITWHRHRYENLKKKFGTPSSS